MRHGPRHDLLVGVLAPARGVEVRGARSTAVHGLDMAIGHSEEAGLLLAQQLVLHDGAVRQDYGLTHQRLLRVDGATASREKRREPAWSQWHPTAAVATQVLSLLLLVPRLRPTLSHSY